MLIDMYVLSYCNTFITSNLCIFCDFNLCIFQIWCICIKSINDKGIKLHTPVLRQTSGKDNQGQGGQQATWFPLCCCLSDRPEVKPEHALSVAGNRLQSHTTDLKSPLLHVGLDGEDNARTAELCRH